jgi:hypothetical protein
MFMALLFFSVESSRSGLYRLLHSAAHKTRSRSYTFALAIALLFSASPIFLGGCSSAMSTPPIPPGPTSVTLQLSSTGNDQFSEFFLTFSSITLTNKAGATVTLYNNPMPAGPGQYAEFIHLNGNSEPLVTVSVPQDVYTSATATFTSSTFTYVTADSAGALTTHFDSISLGTQSATVNLATPITVGGNAMGLLLDLQVSPSVSLTPALNGNGDVYTIKPTFNLTSLAISPQPTSDKNGDVNGIQGRVSAVTAAANSFSIQTTDHAALTIQTGASTTFQGVGAFSALTAGMFVNMDAAIQPDGSLLATRLAVQDTTARNVFMGPIIDHGMTPFDPTAFMVDVLGVQQQGDDLTAQPSSIQRYELESNTTYLTAGEFTNISNLPFTANFGASTLFSGQNLYISSPLISFVAIPLTPATTITLMPQTVNGLVASVSTQGNFQVYIVDLAHYDLLTQLDHVTQVTVYADGNAKTLNSSPIAVGSPFRFSGLLFDDNGTFRMDCGQVNDGVTE